MRYIFITVENYKAITKPISIFFDKYKLSPIIGINESGKSTILEAITLFDYKNHYLFEKNLFVNNFANLYSHSFYNKPSLKAKISASKQELENLFAIFCKKVDHKEILSFENKDLLELNKILDPKNKFKKDKNVVFKNHIENYFIRKKFHTQYCYFYISLVPTVSDRNKVNYEYTTNLFDKENPIIKKFNQTFSLFLIDFLPRIIFYDDFSQKIAQNFYIGTDEKWSILIGKIYFNLYKKEMNDKDPDFKQNIKKLGAFLTEKFNIFSSNLILNQDLEVQKIIISFLLKKDEKNISFLKLNILDQDFKFSLDERSRGFRWFFSFMIHILAYSTVEHNFLENRQKSLILLDEPGSFLHIEAQKVILEILSRLSKQHNIIFTTHSLYMLDVDIIPIKTIQIAKKIKNKDKSFCITLETSKESTEYQIQTISWKPVLDALHLRTFMQLDIKNDFPIVVEGITDFYALNMFLPEVENYKIVPCQGASSERCVISILIGWGVSYLAIWDNDEAGHIARFESEKEYGDIFKNHGLFLKKAEEKEESKKTDKIEIEDMIEKKDWRMIKQSLDLKLDKKEKQCFELLFYSANRQEILSKVSSQTKKNFLYLSNRIKNHFQQIS